MPACLKYRKKTGREGGGGGGKKNSEKRVLSYLNVKRHASRCFRRARSSRTLSCPKGTRYSGRAYFLRNLKKAKCMQGHLAEDTLMTIASSHRWHFFCFVDKKINNGFWLWQLWRVARAIKLMSSTFYHSPIRQEAQWKVRWGWTNY